LERDLLSKSDIVTLHLPLTPSTRNMIALPQLKAMKPTALLINAARGGIVNEKDMFEALKKNLIWGAAIDAWEVEPPTREAYGDDLDLDNLVITPHLGGATAEQQARVCMAMVDRLYWAMTGEKEVDRVI
jgi:D-3-phosphoglycerate dehydrogenase